MEALKLCYCQSWTNVYGYGTCCKSGFSFDGGCPCESGKPIQLAGGGTCNAELAAMFAPRPMLVVSDGGDWTASVPTLEYPYLQRVYGFTEPRTAL